jgi:uncharacterized delta-60 repeat protein
VGLKARWLWRSLGLAMALVVAVAGGASASAATVHLDTSFGEGGKAFVRQKFSGEAGYERLAVATPDGGIVLAAGGTLTKVNSTGQVDESFGVGGTLTPAVPKDGSLEIAGMTVDSQGRLLVAGTLHSPFAMKEASESFGNGNGGTVETAEVIRFLPDGSLDPTFGKGGVVETDLNLPAPTDKRGRQLLPRAWVSVTGIAVDSSDRVILTGGVSNGLAFGCGHDAFWNTVTYAAFVARLTPAGALDPSFGDAGVFAGRQTSENPLSDEFAAEPMVRPGGEIVYQGGSGRCRGGSSGLVELGAAGRLQPGFGAGGAVVGAWGSPRLGPDGSITTMALAKNWRYLRESAQIAVHRYEAGGGADSSFGKGGERLITSPGGKESGLDSMAIDSEGDVILAGDMHTFKKLRHPKGKRKVKLAGSFFTLAGLTPSGAADPAFGTRGWIATRFGTTQVREPQVLIDPQGRPLVVGTYGYPREKGWVIARYTAP